MENLPNSFSMNDLEQINSMIKIDIPKLNKINEKYVVYVIVLLNLL